MNKALSKMRKSNSMLVIKNDERCKNVLKVASKGNKASEGT